MRLKSSSEKLAATTTRIGARPQSRQPNHHLPLCHCSRYCHCQPQRRRRWPPLLSLVVTIVTSTLAVVSASKVPLSTNMRGELTWSEGWRRAQADPGGTHPHGRSSIPQRAPCPGNTPCFPCHSRPSLASLSLSSSLVRD